MEINYKQVEKLNEISKKLYLDFGVFTNIVDKDAKEIFSYNLSNIWKQIQNKNKSIVQDHYHDVVIQNKSDRQPLVSRTQFGLYSLSLPIIVNNFYEGSLILGPFKKDDFNLIETAIASNLNEDDILEYDDSINFNDNIIKNLIKISNYALFFISSLFEYSKLLDVEDKFVILKKITRITNNYLDLSELLINLVKSFTQTNMCDNCSITLFDIGKRYLASKLPLHYKSIEHDNIEEIKSTLKPSYNLNLNLKDDDAIHFSYKNVSSFPLFGAKGELVGVLTLFHNLDVDTRLIEVMCDTISIAMRSASEFSKKTNESKTDPLTKFLNRRSFMNLFKEAIERNKELKKPISVLMIDLDHFGHYNNTNGHVAGDQLLKQMSDIFRDVFKDQIIGRYGGEEFIVVFKDSNFSEAKDLSNELLNRVNNTEFEHAKKQPGGKLTLSIGLFTCVDASCTLKEMILNADQMLYKAKNNGRNQLRISFKASYGTNVIDV